MNYEEVFEAVRNYLVENHGLEFEKITPDVKIGEDGLGLDSLDQVELLTAIEEEFKVEIPDEDAEKLASIDDVINYLLSK